MKSTVEDKLNRIADVWNYFILDYKFCSNKIRFNDDVKTNYFGDMLGYFQDTFDIVFMPPKKNLNYTDRFSFAISFLQAIYIQQDFIEELLEMFKTGMDKGDLKQDTLYSINREIRNELIGHPIRKLDGKLISSTVFSYETKENEIEYLRYHKDNNFKFETKAFKIADIQERHQRFLEKYFDIILSKLQLVLEQYLTKLDNIEKVIKKNHNFETVLKLVELCFEAIFESHSCYDKSSLIEIYNRRNEHIRYKNFIYSFYNDLRTTIPEKRIFVKDIFQRKVIDKDEYKKLLNQIEVVFSNSEETEKDSKPQKVTYHYEIGKLATKRDLRSFGFFSRVLKRKCPDNTLVLTELNHMEQNIMNKIEYYTSLELISVELNEKQNSISVELDA